MAKDGWAFADRSRTTAEIIIDHYRSIRAGADDAVLIGCNTIGHLSAGIFDVTRTGDDTSGKEWDRVRKMGVNTLAFRMPQHGTFFAVDADCVGQTATNSIPWAKNQQWLDLLAQRYAIVRVFQAWLGDTGTGTCSQGRPGRRQQAATGRRTTRLARHQTAPALEIG